MAEGVHHHLGELHIATVHVTHHRELELARCGMLPQIRGRFVPVCKHGPHGRMGAPEGETVHYTARVIPAVAIGLLRRAVRLIAVVNAVYGLLVAAIPRAARFRPTAVARCLVEDDFEVSQRCDRLWPQCSEWREGLRVCVMAEEPVGGIEQGRGFGVHGSARK
jgi:hypothetical protein